MSSRKFTLGMCLGVTMLLGLAGPKVAEARPARLNISKALEAAQKGDGSQLQWAYSAVYDALDVDGLLDVAQAYKRVGNEFLARRAFDQACNVAISWAYYSGYDAKGGDWRYAEEVLPRVTRAPKMYATDGDNGSPRQSAVLALGQLRGENKKGAPRVVAGLWASNKRETQFVQNGLVISASNNAMTMRGEMRVSGDWIYIVGTVKKKDGKTGAFNGRIHLRQSNVMYTTIYYKDENGKPQRFADQIRRP